MELSSGGLVELLYEHDPARLACSPIDHDGLWRYRDLIPLELGPVIYPLAFGGTPLVASPGLRKVIGCRHLWVKDETRGPSRSSKDRATALVLEHALRQGQDTVTCVSTGNVEAALAVGAAAAGKRAVIFVPADVDESKLSLMVFSGATVVKVQEGYTAAFHLSRQAARVFGWCDRNTGVNPLTVEAKKTVAFEIWEQLGRQVPDVVVALVGDGPTLCGLAKGFRELVACGVAERMPRLIGVQAEGCQPVKRAWEAGASTIEPVEPRTLADGIAVGVPVNGLLALRDVRESGGGFVAVSDAELLEAVRTLARRGGLLAEPAGAAAYAGLLRALESRLVDRDERIVTLLTGTLLKTPRFLRPASPPLEVEADLDALERALASRPAR
jgi:threonine synthase